MKWLRTGLALAALLAAFSARGREAVLTVLHTTDVHGAFERGGPGREGSGGGMVQCASLIRAACAENPCHLLLDGGDFATGTAASAASMGVRMAQVFNLLGYDAVALGNHEFDWGADAAARMLETLEAPVLAANFRAGEDAPAAFGKVLPFVVKDVEGLRVAVVGLTTPNLPNWFRWFRGAGLDTEGSLAALERTLPLVKAENPDILIVLAHQGLLVKDDDSNEINLVGNTFPEIDLLLGGHLHWVQEGAKIGRVDYAQSGSGARGVMRIDLTYDTAARQVVSKRFRFLPVEEDTSADGPVKALVREDCEAAAAELSEKLGTAPRSLAASVSGAGLCPLQQLYARAMMEATGAEAAMQGVYSGERLAAGDVTMGDLWRLVPHENLVGTVMLTAAELKEAMEDSMDLWGTSRYAPVTGVSYDLYPNAPKGERVRNLRRSDGRPLHWRARVKLAANSYLLAGGGGRFPSLAAAAGRPEARLSWARDSLRDLVAAWIRRRGTVEVPAGTDARIFLRERRPYEREEDFEHSLE